jgi:hypothetical protein
LPVEMAVLAAAVLTPLVLGQEHRAKDLLVA